MGFQTKVNLYPAPAVAGDFASANPRQVLVSPESGFVAGANGLNVGVFCWVDSTGQLLNNTGQGVPDGFVHREQQAALTAYLAEYGNNVPAGFQVEAMRTGDYFAAVTGQAAVRGMKAFAKFQTGDMYPAAAGSTINTSAFTASQTGNVLTVSAMASGALSVGDQVYGGNALPITYIESQTSGTPGGVGSYTVSSSGSMASGATSGTSYVETPFVIAQAANVGELTVMTQ